MSRPDDIPQDVWDAANRISEEVGSAILGRKAPQEDLDLPVIVARAIMAERERCAALVERQTTAQPQRNTKSMWIASIGKSLAAAIRKGGA